jgi:2-polyprenyl-3-methyl-5-hydroxy-6-metoxy-1,4-benzoquinol methylase/uncharacterized protein YbaR (Trm112 family)
MAYILTCRRSTSIVISKSVADLPETRNQLPRKPLGLARLGRAYLGPTGRGTPRRGIGHLLRTISIQPASANVAPRVHFRRLRRKGRALLDESFLRVLGCPMDHTPLRPESDVVVCEQNHRFPVEQGVPLFTSHPRREPMPLNMPPCSQFAADGATAQPIDAFVNDWIVNTNGNLYWRVRGRLPRYPIPNWPFGNGSGKTLLDIGCSWGRWCVAASRAGFRPIGMDVHIDALAAATRVSRQLDATCNFVCSNADALPVQSRSIDCVFSYSVLQHIDRAKVIQIFHEIARILKPGGHCIIQLPNTLGPLSALQQLKRGFREAKTGTFEMRYWSRKTIRKSLSEAGLCGVQIHADGFLSQNPQLSDLDLLTPAGKLIVLASYAGHKAANALPILTRVADSLWIEAQAPPDAR